MTPWQRARRTRFREAFALAAVLIASAALLVPKGWIRWAFEREFRDLGPDPADRFETTALRLVPAPRVERPPVVPRFPTEPRPERRVPTVEPVPEEPEDAATSEHDPYADWQWDPFNAYTTADDIFRVGPVSLPDSTAQRAELLRSLTLTDLRYAMAMVDTSQAALAHEQLRWVDDWVNEIWGPIWEAQGYNARMRDLMERAVLEAERDGM